MRPIDADGLLKEINDVYNGYMLSEQFAPADFQRMVEEAPTVETVPAEKWIPITERLPNKSGRYLVSYDSGYVAMALYYESVSKWGSTTTERIVAWMPLPEPYKGVNE